jgi:hypothetical protein
MNQIDFTVGRSRTGDVVPDYKLAISRGQNASSLFSAWTRDLKLVQGRYSVEDVWLDIFGEISSDHVYYIAQGSFVAVPDSSDLSPSLEPAANMAKKNFVNKAKQVQQSFLGGVFLGEFREILHSIRNPAQALRTGIADYFSAARRRRRGNARTRLKVLQDTWLEYSFAWKPLVSDLDAAAKTLAEWNMQRLPFELVTGYGRNREEVSHTVIEQTSGTLRWNENRVVETDTIVILRSIVHLDVSGTAEMRRIGLTLDEFVPTLWELIPYSFLVDYFTNIGDILSSATWARTGLVGVFRTDVQYSIYRNFTSNPTYAESANPFLVSRNLISRTPCESIGTFKNVFRYPTDDLTPAFQLEVPGMGTKWINLAALAQSRRGLRPY